MDDPADVQGPKRTTQEIARDVYKLIPREQHEAAEKLLRELVYTVTAGAYRIAFDNNPAVRA